MSFKYLMLLKQKLEVTVFCFVFDLPFMLIVFLNYCYVCSVIGTKQEAVNLLSLFSLVFIEQYMYK